MKRIGLLILLTAILTACGEKPAFHEYRAVPAEGWGKTDTLEFPVDTLPSGGDYALALHVRTASSKGYPYQALWVGIRRTWGAETATRIDTLACRLANADGDILGKGIIHRQYAFPLDTLRLPAATDGHISVHHLMQDDTLHGIADIGIRIDKL